jgi:hypothetical protein
MPTDPSEEKIALLTAWANGGGFACESIRGGVS